MLKASFPRNMLLTQRISSMALSDDLHASRSHLHQTSGMGQNLFSAFAFHHH